MNAGNGLLHASCFMIRSSHVSRLRRSKEPNCCLSQHRKERNLSSRDLRELERGLGTSPEYSRDWLYGPNGADTQIDKP